MADRRIVHARVELSVPTTVLFVLWVFLDKRRLSGKEMGDFISWDNQFIRNTYPLIINDHFPRFMCFRNSSFKWVVIGVTNPTNFIGILMIKFFKVSWNPTLEKCN